MHTCLLALQFRTTDYIIRYSEKEALVKEGLVLVTVSSDFKKVSLGNSWPAFRVEDNVIGLRLIVQPYCEQPRRPV